MKFQINCFLFTLLLAIFSPQTHGHGLEEDEKDIWLIPEDPSDTKQLKNSGLAISDSVIDQFKIWEASQILNVCFYDTDSAAIDYFVEVASIWDEVISTNFNFGESKNYNNCTDSGPFHIRVLLKQSAGNWSYIGTDSIKVDQVKPTLAVSTSTPFELNDKRKLGGTILHELGHALAMRHEHQSPESKCEDELDWPLLYSELGQPPNEWTEEKVDQNLRRRIQSDRFKATEYDKNSIMHYALPARWFHKGAESDCFINRNTGLSKFDVSLAKETYPSTPQKQDNFLAKLHSNTAVALAEKDLSSSEERLIEKLITDAIGTNSNRNIDTNLGIKIFNIKAETSGSCSPIITDTGDIVINC